MSTVLRMPGISALPKSAPRAVRSKMDTVLLTHRLVESWKRPPSQRELRVTPKVLAVAEELKVNGGVISGVLTLGVVDGVTYLLDGQHRVEAYKLSKLEEAIADVRICTFDDLGEMALEFVRLNSPLVRMKNDDIVRALELSNEWIALIRKQCPFVGYNNIRMPGGKIVLAMAAAIRTWFGSLAEAPNPGPPSSDSVELLDKENTPLLIRALGLCWDAWGRETENFRLWGTLNLVLVFWLYRRLVLREGASSRPRRGGVEITVLNDDQFRQCLMALSSNKLYVDHLMGRALKERDRGPTYNRAKAIFAGRLGGMGFGRPCLPIPEWASH